MEMKYDKEKIKKERIWKEKIEEKEENDKERKRMGTNRIRKYDSIPGRVRQAI